MRASSPWGGLPKDASCTRQGPPWQPSTVRDDREPLPSAQGGLGRWAAARRHRALAQAAAAASETWTRRLGPHGSAPERVAALDMLRARLRRDGWQPAHLAEALGAACGAATVALGRTPYPSQREAAAAMLDRHVAELPTGGGKTLALALAAAAGALAGLPVHVATANDYLAARDAAALQPLYACLGLSVAAVTAASAPSERAALYRADVVHTTVRELAFDHLRDRLAAGPTPLDDAVNALVTPRAAAGQALRGLGLALLDEADSLLLDEADVPLVISRPVPQAARRAFHWQALALARGLDASTDWVVEHDLDRVRLTPAGEAALARRAAPLGGPWRRPRARHEAIGQALRALHLRQAGTHYVVRDGALVLVDELTGRAAPGRVWSHGLHAMVELKEGLRPGDDTETLARIGVTRLMRRYQRLGGASGTVREARAELAALYGLGVAVIAPRHAPTLVTWPPRCFPDDAARLQAVAARAAAIAATGRPVLVGTDHVADSRCVAEHLAAQGVPHAVLDAEHDADEARVVADAGRAGRITVATRMAGRGTDIVLDDAARAAGGLHVLNTQHNPSRRLDRQLAGRAARHGEPGTTESWTRGCFSTDSPDPGPPTLEPWTPSPTGPCPAILPSLPRPAWGHRLSALVRRLRQSMTAARRRAARHRAWQHELATEDRLGCSGRGA